MTADALTDSPSSPIAAARAFVGTPPAWIRTYCRSSIISCALNPGSAAKAAEEKKRAKYSELSDRFRFEPVAVETSGVIGPSTLKFLIELGQRMRQHTGERREGLWLLQRISFAIVRGNAASVAATGNLY